MALIVPANPIVKLTYKHSFFDITERKIGARTITTITDDGVITIREYKSGSRKAHATYTTSCSTEAYRSLCDSLEHCINCANRWDMWIDDCSEELTLVYKHARVQTVDRGLANGDDSIGGIMREFLSQFCMD